jgi:glucokinase
VSPAVLGIDVGGTRTKAGVYADGGLVVEAVEPTPRGPRVVAEVVELAARLAGELGVAHPIGAIGLAVPGLVDRERGVAVWSANLGWRDAPLVDLLSARTGLPVAIGHDVRAATAAEASTGAGAGRAHLVHLAIGTGIAAGIVLDGVLLDPPRPVGEVGHLDVGHDLACACGRTGCLEVVASAAGIAARYAARTGRRLDAREVAERVDGDPDARAVWDDATEAIARVVGLLDGVLAPELVVLGGGLARAGDRLVEPLRRHLAARGALTGPPEVVVGRYADRAGCVGAGLLAARLLGASA